MRVRVDPHRAVAGALVIAMGLVVAIGAPQVWAGPPPDAPRAFVAPWTERAEIEGAEATFTHAAGLGFLSGAELGLGVTTRLAGDEAINAAYGVAAGRLGPLALGLALGGVGDGPGTDTTTTRFDVALAWRLSEGLSLGFRWMGLYNRAEAGLDDFDTWSASASLRPSRGLALALAVDGFDRPAGPGGGFIEPIARAAVGIRPGTERVTIGLEGARTLADEGRWTAGASVRFMVTPGLSLGGYGRFHADDAGGGTAEIVEAGALLGLSQGLFGLDSSVDVRAIDGDGVGLTHLLKVGTTRRPSLVTRGDVVVKVSLSGDLAERPTQGLLGVEGVAFGHWLQALDLIGRDDDVSGVVFVIESAPSWGQSWELRRVIARLQERGKRVHAVLTLGDMRSMYLASAADRVHLYEAGGLFLTGLAITRTYIFGLLEKLGVNPEIVRWEDYKSAPERLTATGPSPPAQEQTQALLDGVEEAWMAAVSAGRGLSRDALSAALEDGPQTMHTAKSRGLVDALVHEDALREALTDDFGPDVSVVDRYRPSPSAWRRWGRADAVAVIPVVGSIVDGSSAGGLPIPLLGDETTGDQTVIRALSAAASDSSVAGIVVRVDSGGGSAIASDKMHAAVMRAAESKPLVVSFGSSAASGGYYLAAGAPTILTTPLTVTGSIGIFAGKADISGLYAMLGVTTHTTRSHPRADMMATHRPWTDAERDAAHQRLGAYYDRFVDLVAEGRGLTSEAAHRLARGRVYLGARALELDLADAEGGLWDAIMRVRAEAGLDVDAPLRVRYLGSLEPLSGVQRLVTRAAGLDEAVASPPRPDPDSVIGRVTRLLGVLRSLDSHGYMAVSPWTFTIE